MSREGLEVRRSAAHGANTPAIAVLAQGTAPHPVAHSNSKVYVNDDGRSVNRSVHMGYSSHDIEAWDAIVQRHRQSEF